MTKIFEKVVRAEDIVPGLYDSNNDNSDNLDDNSNSEDNSEDEAVIYEDAIDATVTYDLYNLAAFNHAPLKDSSEKFIKENTQYVTQLLVNKIFDCQVENTDEGPVAILPNESRTLPREKPVPQPKPLTKWEQFAASKGIQNKKKERMIWDEERQQYLPRYGYKRKKEGIEEYGVVEIKNGQDPYEDPFAKSKNEKKERIQKNLKAQAGNLKRTGRLESSSLTVIRNNKRDADKGTRGKGKGRSGLSSISIDSYSAESVPGIPMDLHGEEKKGKAGLKRSLELAQRSTASLGRFNTKRQDEPDIKIKGLKRKFRDNNTVGATDKKTMRAQLRQVYDKVDKKARGVTNSLKAYEGILPDAPTDSFKKSKGKGQVHTDPKAKGKGKGGKKGK